MSHCPQEEEIVSSNSVPIMYLHRVRCAVMLPESNKSLRDAGASDHECDGLPEWAFETRIAGIKCVVYFCTRHNGEVQRTITERRIESRKQKNPAVHSAEAAVATKRDLLKRAIKARSFETAQPADQGARDQGAQAPPRAARRRCIQVTHVIPALVNADGVKSCDTCKWMKKSPTVDEPTVCGAMGSRPVDLTIMTKDQATAQRTMIGEGCGWYNNDSPNTRYNDSVPVAFPLREPDPEKISSYQRAAVQSCLDCENYAPPSEAAKLGFGSGRGICVAKGVLLRSDRLRPIAANCDVRRKGRPVDGAKMTMLKVFPEYTLAKVEAFIEENNRKRSMTCLPDGFDPVTHTSPVTAEHQAMGIRAWINVSDPTGTGNTVALPIFDPMFFNEIERAKIQTRFHEARPDLYIDHAGLLYRTAVGLMQLDKTPTLWGMPGVGKTEFARYLAWIMQLPFERISITDTTELDDLQGSVRFEANETVFHPGRVTRSWGKPGILLIDEPNVGPRAVWQFLRPLTDNSKPASCSTPTRVSTSSATTTAS